MTSSRTFETSADGWQQQHERRTRKRPRNTPSALPSRRSSPWMVIRPLWALLWCFLADGPVGVRALENGECFRHLSAADAANGGGDGQLTPDEYVDALRRLSYGIISTVPTFANLPPSLQQPYRTAQAMQQISAGVPLSLAGLNRVVAPPGSSSLVTAVPPPILNTMCRSIYSGVLEPLGISEAEFNTESCFFDMSIGDQAGLRDDLLQREVEYPVFINRLVSNRLFSTTPTFAELSLPLQLVFADFADRNNPMVVVITGTKPTQTPPPGLGPTLANFCNQVRVAMEAGKVLDNFPTFAPSTVGTLESLPDFTFRECTNSMAVADLVGVPNDRLNPEEFIYYLFRLTGGRFEGANTLDELPTCLQHVYFNNVQQGTGQNTDGLDIAGALSSSNPTTEQLTNLQFLCEETRVALVVGSACRPINGPPVPTAPVSPRALPTLPPTPQPQLASGPVLIELPLLQCTIAMTSADEDNSLSLSPQEYVAFVNRAFFFTWRDLEFLELPVELLDNYNNLAGNSGEIPIEGSNPFLGQPTAAERVALVRICDSTALAISRALSPPTPPVPAPPTPRRTRRPTTPFPTLPPIPRPPPATSPTPTNTGTITVDSAFVISNTRNLRVRDVSAGPDFFAMVTGYETFVTNLIGDSASNAFRRRQSQLPDDEAIHLDHVTINLDDERQTTIDCQKQRERRLPAQNVVPGSVSLYQINPIVCPSYVTTVDVTCHVVYGTFQANYRNEPDEMSLVEELTFLVQGAVGRPDETGLRFLVEEANPAVRVVVEGVPEDGRVRPPLEPTPVPTFAPTLNVTSRLVDSGDSGGIPVLLLAVALGGGAVLCCCCFFFFRQSQESGGGLWGSGKHQRRKHRGDMSGSSQSSSWSESDEDQSRDPEVGRGRSIPGDDDDDGGLRIPTRSRLGLPNRLGFDRGERARTAPKGGDDEGSSGFSVQDSEPSENGGGKVGNKVFGALGANVKRVKRALNRNNDVNAGEEDPQDIHAILGHSIRGDLATYEFDDHSFGREKSVAGQESEGGGTSFRSFGGTSYDSAEVSEEEDETTDEGGEEEDDSYSAAHGPPPSIHQFNNMVKSGDWQQAIRASKRYHPDDQSNPSMGFSASQSEATGSDSSYSESSRRQRLKALANPDGSLTSEELRHRHKYYSRVHALVKQVVPEETNNVQAMLDKFEGREDELIHTLETMQERSRTVRARKAIHKSKTIPELNPNAASRAAVAAPPTGGSAAVAAAASTNIGSSSALRGDTGDLGFAAFNVPELPEGEDEDDDDYGSEESSDEDESDGSDEDESEDYDDESNESDENEDEDQSEDYTNEQAEDEEESGTYEDGEEGSGTYDDEEEGSGTYDDEEDASGTYDDEEDASGSSDNGEEDATEDYENGEEEEGEGSEGYSDEDEGSINDAGAFQQGQNDYDEDSGSGEYDDDDGGGGGWFEEDTGFQSQQRGQFGVEDTFHSTSHGDDDSSHPEEFDDSFPEQGASNSFDDDEYSSDDHSSDDTSEYS